jgi:hypothetical protein
MNRFHVRAVAIAGVAFLYLSSVGASSLWAQSNPFSTDLRKNYQRISEFFTRAAEKMPERKFFL